MYLWNRYSQTVKKQSLIKRTITGAAFFSASLLTLNAFAITPHNDTPYGQTTPYQSFSPIVTTRDYVQICGDYQTINQNTMMQRTSKHWQRCYAYTSATMSTMRDMERTSPLKQFCVPKNVSTEYAIELTVKYTKKLPETLNENPAKIVLEALAVRYPC